jgi:hypothetical protein
MAVALEKKVVVVAYAYPFDAVLEVASAHRRGLLGQGREQRAAGACTPRVAKAYQHCVRT